jgi:hypothetical protein
MRVCTANLVATKIGLCASQLNNTGFSLLYLGRLEEDGPFFLAHFVGVVGISHLLCPSIPGKETSSGAGFLRLWFGPQSYIVSVAEIRR